MRIERLDHLVLTVADFDAAVAFDTRALGVEHVVVEEHHALRFGAQKINLHRAEHPFEAKAMRPTPGAGDLCLVVAADHLTDVATHLASCDVAIEEGPVGRTGALGPIRSLNVRDPDRNLIELAVYETATGRGVVEPARS